MPRFNNINIINNINNINYSILYDNLYNNLLNEELSSYNLDLDSNKYSKISCPICKIESFYSLEERIKSYIPTLESSCPICMSSNVNTRLKCGHCYCVECVDTLSKKSYLTNEIENNKNDNSIVKCKTCNIEHSIDINKCKIYGIDVLCSHCNKEPINIILPCDHYTCYQCIMFSL